jgi:glycosyltransferase involved in cell wall biosynthesis
MKFSIIVPSYNQHVYIEETILNLLQIKEKAAERKTDVELILVDNLSEEPTKSIIQKYASRFDAVVIEKDEGQYDAINKGLRLVNGDYWTWLNTDDLMEVEGFMALAELLRPKPDIDYIYGGVNYMDEKGKWIKTFPAYALSAEKMVAQDPAVFQPGSFFRTAFTKQIGGLKPYRCCFDYEYVLRCMRHQAKIRYCDFPVSRFRYYRQSKTGSITPVFIREQLQISAEYGRKWFSFLTWFSYVRLFKHFLFPRK